MRKSLLILCCLIACLSRASVVNYTADDVSVFPNPERGFTEELGGETRLSDDKNHVVKDEAASYFGSAARQSQRLVMLMYYLYNYRSKDLSEAILKGFDEDMAILRQYGFKCVLRFAYDWKKKDDATVTQAKKHIAQLKPYLAKNADVIYVLETGFVGRWGEWYYSSNYTDKSQHLNDKRRQVLEAMLDACPANRFLLVRYPLIKTEYLGDENALTSEEAFSGSVRARIGHHNDAFLSNYGNDGTYGRDGDGPEDDPKLRQYIAQETLFVPNGGETNVEDDELAGKVYNQAESEMATYHWSFCGSTYAENVTNRWHSSGIYEHLERKLGYRYQLTTATFPDEATVGEKARFILNIRNVGFAPLYNERHAYIVLKNQQSVFCIQLASDPRCWLPNGVVTKIDENLSIPADIPNGTYQLYLHLPDASPDIAADPRYAVRFANEGVWEEETGMNKLNATIRINGSTAINQTETAPQVHKILRNGQLLIRKNGKIYTLQGQKMN